MRASSTDHQPGRLQALHEQGSDGGYFS